MGLNDTPSANRVHIAFFGKRNAGKSSLLNAVTSQSLSIVSDIPGTTTDPVSKAMELLPLGPVVIIDTAGIDDVGELGALRIAKTRQTLNKTDIAVLVTDGSRPLDADEEDMISLFEKKSIPYVLAYNKCDLYTDRTAHRAGVFVSAVTGEGIDELKALIASARPEEEAPHRIVSDLLEKGDIVLLVVPIDSSAPKGRLILPQQQTIRDIIEADAIAVTVKDTELADAVEKLGDRIRLVITDSQIFASVGKIVPESIPLTSFSILMARYKGFLETAAMGAAAIRDLKDGDKILISEGCTHHRQCADIGTVKIPALIRRTTGADILFETTSGTEFPTDLSGYKLVIHCGGCMLTEREVTYRMKCVLDAGIPFTNYGTAIAYMTGILERSLKPLGIQL